MKNIEFEQVKFIFKFFYFLLIMLINKHLNMPKT